MKYKDHEGPSSPSRHQPCRDASASFRISPAGSHPTTHKRLVLNANWGTFEDESGAALSGAVRIYHNVQLNGSFAYGFRENMTGGSTGVRFGFQVSTRRPFIRDRWPDRVEQLRFRWREHSRWIFQPLSPPCCHPDSLVLALPSI